MSKIDDFYKSNRKEILDIILFGSEIRGKESPADVDLLVIYKEDIDLDLSYELKKEVSFIGKVEITSKTYLQLFEPSFMAREAVLSEGYSLIRRSFVHQSLGYSSFILFKYNLEGLNKTRRMQFYYSLYGRTKEGMLKELNSYKFSESMILTPVNESEKMKEYLSRWVKFVEISCLIPSRLSEVLRR